MLQTENSAAHIMERFDFNTTETVKLDNHLFI
jgi:hypothetical protein